jgi:hypothetical protein
MIALLLMAVACGQAQAPTSPVAAVDTPSATVTAAPSPSPSPTASPKPSPLPLPSTSATLLFAALEGNNTVAIAGLDGYARAKTTFIPMPVPDVGCMGANLPQSAQVADGKVYFADGKGVVRSLAANGQITRVASFPFSGHQQMLSFAVSPDGTQLLGAVLTVPAKFFPCSGGPPLQQLSLDVYSAHAGGASTLLYHEKLPNTVPGPDVLKLVGWDKVGPVATYPTDWADQGGGPRPNFFGTPVRVDASTGKVVGQVADPNSCEVWAMAFSGDFVCIPNGSARISVRRPDGSEIWHFTATAGNSVYNPLLAPDEQHLVVDGTNYDTEGVGAKNGSRVNLGSQAAGQFYVSGWLDSITLIGGDSNTNLAYVRLSAPGTIVSLGFQGMFVGTVQT